jgi:hypothetical protein
MCFMSKQIKNWKPSTLDAGIVISTGSYGLDVNWTTYLDPTTNYKTTVYVIETWERLTNDGWARGTTACTVEVARPTGEKTGWCVRLFGEELPERYSRKGEAQFAAEALVVA